MANMKAVDRHSAEYKMWRAKVYASDGWECIVCSSKKRIEAHHLLPVRKYPELALDENNGVTMCFSCHRLIFGKEEELVNILTGLKANRVNSVKSLTHEVSKANTEPSHAGDSVKGVTTRERVFKIEQFVSIKVKCSWCSKELERHFYRNKRSKIFFCSGKCHGKWSVGKKIGDKNPMWKPIQISFCGFCKKELTPTPSDKHRKKKFCSNSCHTSFLWKTGNYKREKINRWSRNFEACTQCTTTSFRHYGKGLCMKCYNKRYNVQSKRQ